MTLIAVAVVAGLATFLSPCVLPVIPVIAAASSTGGRRRPVGIAVGLFAAFVVFTLTASRLLSALGLPQDLLRNLAIALLAVVGLMLLIPPLGELAGRLFQPLARAAGTRAHSRDGFWSGALLGSALALVWTPCAGPILAAITVVSAQHRVSLELVLITVAYALGATAPLFLVALAGNRATARMAGLRRSGPLLRQAAGVVLVAAAWLFTTDLPTNLAASVPSYVSSLQHVERSASVQRDLRHLTVTGKASAAALAAGNSPDALHNYGKAPNFAGISTWINTPGGRPLSLPELHGKVVLVDFWTYSCVNCIRTLPHLKAWYARYHRAGLVIVGVHTPEFPFEHVVSNVQRAVSEHGIDYPVAIDNGYDTWNAWGNEYWPADYLIDRDGDVRDAHFGEGAYGQTEDAIRRLLDEPASAPRATVHHPMAVSRLVATPETYLGSSRGVAYTQAIHHGTWFTYTPPHRVGQNAVELGGRWEVLGERIVAGRSATLAFRYTAPRIYLVAAPGGGPVTLGVSVDGRRPHPLRIPDDDLYPLADLPTPGPHLLHLTVPRGASLYSFTFG
ncbi:MAG TPA: cytochrome c biogenesis protein CcdA [Gaiellales bacterium]|nr:cytochrome c biogenesis protein CcdA [Gaiellales bacterium]